MHIYTLDIFEKYSNLFLFFNLFSVMYKLMASTSEGIRVQALKAMGYFLKHLAPK